MNATWGSTTAMKKLTVQILHRVSNAHVQKDRDIAVELKGMVVEILEIESLFEGYLQTPEKSYKHQLTSHFQAFENQKNTVDFFFNEHPF